MSLREHFRADGKPKTGWRDEQTVRDVVDNLMESEPEKNVTYYICSFCDFYHIGTWGKKK